MQKKPLASPFRVGPLSPELGKKNSPNEGSLFPSSSPILEVESCKVLLLHLLNRSTTIFWSYCMFSFQCFFKPLLQAWRGKERGGHSMMWTLTALGGLEP